VIFGIFSQFTGCSPVQTGFRTRTEQAEPVLSGSVPVPVLFWPRTVSSVLGSPKTVEEPD